MKGFFSNLRTRGAECQMALQYEEDISPSLMLQEQRKGEIQLTAKRKKDFFLVSPAKKGSEPWQKGTKKLGRFLGWFFASKEMFG